MSLEKVEFSQQKENNQCFPCFFFPQQLPPIDSELSIYVDEQSPAVSPLPSPTKLIREDNAAVTKAGNDIEQAADQNDDSDSDSDNEKKKPVFK